MRKTAQETTPILNYPQKLDDLQGDFMADCEKVFKRKVVKSFFAGDGGTRPLVDARIEGSNLGDYRRWSIAWER